MTDFKAWRGWQRQQEHFRADTFQSEIPPSLTIHPCIAHCSCLNTQHSGSRHRRAQLHACYKDVDPHPWKDYDTHARDLKIDSTPKF